MFKCSDVLRGESKGPVLVEWTRVVPSHHFGTSLKGKFLFFNCLLWAIKISKPPYMGTTKITGLGRSGGVSGPNVPKIQALPKLV